MRREGETMKRIATIAALALLAAASARAQWLGVPAWNSPKGGAGITVSADYGRTDYDSDTDPLKATTFGARGSVGLGRATIAVGLSSFNPEGALQTVTAVGAQGAYRVIGGSLLPVSVNLQGGVSRHGVVDGGPENITNWLAGVGVSTTVPTPAVSFEPYVSVSNRWHKVGGASESNVGFVIGANVNVGTLGLHLAYDAEKDDSGSRFGVFGVGAHVALRAPVGL
jgi:hypothetical protein